MKKVVLLWTFGLLISCNLKENTNSSDKQSIFNPEKLYGDLFHDVQISEVFSDVKTFPDCIPIESTEDIKKLYEVEKNNPEFNLKAFVNKHFKLPPSPKTNKNIVSDTIAEKDFNKNIISLWDQLTRQPDSILSTSSLIPLPNKYVVPGGRFKEIYYWDSYFTLIGLAASGKLDLVEDMLDNFSYLIDEFGFIPNGNRTYYLSRSQPPFFSSMVMLYSQYVGMEKTLKYLPHLEKEYAFWMEGKDQVSIKNKAFKKVVWLDANVVLNRYRDTQTSLRPEGYLTDFNVLEKVDKSRTEEVMAHRRAACESGWDFSSRWLTNSKEGIENMITSDLLPVDLNCLLYHLEESIAKLSKVAGDLEKESEFKLLASRRKEAINKYFWDTDSECYKDYNFKLEHTNAQVTLASNFPLYFKIASDYQARCQERLMRENFLFSGGLVTTLAETGEQWDYPNGWAPLQWISIKGLEHYNYLDLANTVQNRWLDLNKKVFSETGKMMEKYNVVDLSLTAGGGEYPTVDGFGWTNGVAIALLKNTNKY